MYWCVKCKGKKALTFLFSKPSPVNYAWYLPVCVIWRTGWSTKQTHNINPALLHRFNNHNNVWWTIFKQLLSLFFLKCTLPRKTTNVGHDISSQHGSSVRPSHPPPGHKAGTEKVWKSVGNTWTDFWKHTDVQGRENPSHMHHHEDTTTGSNLIIPHQHSATTEGKAGPNYLPLCYSPVSTAFV